MMALHRANPKFGTVGHFHEVNLPLPGCLETLLNKNILKNAKRDRLAKVRRAVLEFPDVQAALKAAAPKLKPHFEAAVKGDTSVQTTGSKLVMGMDAFCQDLVDRKVAKDIIVKPTPAVKGMVPPNVHSNLAWLDAKAAFVSGQKADEKDADKMTIDFDEFLHCLALVGHLKYEEVGEMSLLQRVEGVLGNYLGERDEHDVITAALFPPMERFDAAAAASGADADCVATWAKMDLSHVFGFPTWEKEVFGLFAASFPELKSIFDQYAKSGTAGSASAGAAMTMQQTELQNLALDCELSTEAFNMTRVINIFKRADQVDDTFQVSKADRRVVTGETAKGGDRGLELHEVPAGPPRSPRSPLAPDAALPAAQLTRPAPLARRSFSSASSCSRSSAPTPSLARSATTRPSPCRCPAASRPCSRRICSPMPSATSWR
jgi:hypothetical protein